MRHTYLLLLFCTIAISALGQNGAVKLNASNTDSYVDAGYNDDYLTEGSYTYQAWIYLEAANTNGYIMATEDDQKGFSFRMSTNDAVEFVHGIPGWHTINSGEVTVPLKTWTHVAATYDGTDLVLLMNGDSVTSNQPAEPMITSTQNLIIGEGATWKERRFTGIIDNVQIWSEARSETAIKESLFEEPAGTETGLIAAWLFNEVSGSTASSAGGAYAATLGNSVTRVSLKEDFSLVFDKSQTPSLVDFGVNASLSPAAPFTIEAMVCPFENNNGYIVSGENGTDGPNGITLRMAGTYGVDFYFGGSGNWNLINSGDNALDSGKWSHVVGTYAEDTLRLYINGSEMAKAYNTNAVGVSTTAFTVGEGSEYRDRGFTGKIDNVRLWNTAIKSGEVLLLKDTIIEEASDDLIAAWAFNEGAGNTTTDVAQVYTGTLSNVTWVQNGYYVTQSTDTENQAPQASATVDIEDGVIGQTFAFDASGSSDRDGDALTYTWDFGDGNSESGESVSHAYDTEGEYEVVLMVSDGEASSTASLSVSVSVNQNPIAAFTSSATSGFLVLTVDFDASTTVDPEGHELSYDWDFGDGNTGEGVQVTHSFEQVGTFDVVLTVSDSYGGSATESTTVGVLEEQVTLSTDSQVGLQVYPNPVNDFVKIEGLEGAFTYSIIGMDGRVYLSQDTQQTSLNISHLPKGMYLIEISNDKVNISQKVLKQ
ncbi:LamG-like jellyroll fold domain-containing protein [Marinoscillum luteum]|uniref:LamG-like jellyroll fold domain-containing protein n=1 Tax=Marinoscillum luteum TaxID=861051 RepID=A0ABW7N5I3_9BACT